MLLVPGNIVRYAICIAPGAQRPQGGFCAMLVAGEFFTAVVAGSLVHVHRPHIAVLLLVLRLQNQASSLGITYIMDQTKKRKKRKWHYH